MPPPPDAHHNYAAPVNFELPTPLEKIPRKFRKKHVLSGGKVQIIDSRLAYNWDRERNMMVECGSVSGDAKYED